MELINQMDNLGIIVFGHRRERHLWCVLESLKRQGALGMTHVWIDGYDHFAALKEHVEACCHLNAVFPEARWQFINGRLGIEKLMLDGLTFMARNYERIIILEDDCFPTHNAVEVFSEMLMSVEKDPSVYSVYGHHWLVPNEGRLFPRFQGWGWATTRAKLIPVLSQLKSMFMMTEPDYLEWVNSALTEKILATLDQTKGRDVEKILRRRFTWDSATALLTAILGLLHAKTPERVVYNFGLGLDSGHFHGDLEFYRHPPFNMITIEEVWEYFDKRE